MSETTQPLYGATAREVGMTIREAADSATVARARRLLAEADAVDMGSPESMARAIGKLSVAVEMLLERIGGAAE